MFKRGLLLILISLLLQSCQTTNNAMFGEKRSEKKDEFFIEKKNPLSMPPDFNELPEPRNNDNENISTNGNLDSLEETLKAKNNKKNKTISENNTIKSLDKRILEKIN